MIPVIGTAVMKNPYWVERLYKSIDYPVDNFVIFNNNGKDDAIPSVAANFTQAGTDPGQGRQKQQEE